MKSEDVGRVQGTLRVFAVSDLHTHHRENMAWVHNLSTSAFTRDAVIVAGDVSDDIQELRETLTALKRRFAVVFFCPGNHELWVRGASSRHARTQSLGGGHASTHERGSADESGQVRRACATATAAAPAAEAPPAADSIQKLAAVMATSEECGAVVGPARLGRLRIVPLLSWHHKAFDREPDIPGIPRASPMTISDYARCVWPSDLWERCETRGHDSGGPIGAGNRRTCDHEWRTQVNGTRGGSSSSSSNTSGGSNRGHQGPSTAAAESDGRNVTCSTSLDDDGSGRSDQGHGQGQGSCAVAAWFDTLNDAPGGWRGALGLGTGSLPCDSGVGGGPGPPDPCEDDEAEACTVSRASERLTVERTGPAAGTPPGATTGGKDASAAAGSGGGGGEEYDVLSFSHFLPLQELLPEKRFLTYPNLAKAVGSTYLGERVRMLGPRMHIFGHTHFAWDAVHAGIRYVQVPLAYPSERRFRMRTLLLTPAEAPAATPAATSAATRRAEQDTSTAVAAEATAPSGGGSDTEPWPTGSGAGDTAWLPLCVYRAHYSVKLHGAGAAAAAAAVEREELPAAALLLRSDVGDAGGGGGGLDSDAADGSSTAAPASAGGALPLSPQPQGPSPLRVEVLEWRSEWRPQQQASWSAYYARHPRRPDDLTLAPWVAERYSRRRRHSNAVHAAEAAAEKAAVTEVAGAGGASGGGEGGGSGASAASRGL